MIVLPASIGMVAPAAGAPASAYWNPADIGTGISLSSGNAVATFSNASWRSVRSVTSHTSGKRYAEMVRGATANWSEFFGVANSSASLAEFAGQNGNSWGAQTGDGPGSRLFRNGSPVGSSITTISNGSYGRIALDFDAGNGWIGNPTDWFGGGDPGAGTSPSFTFTPGAQMFLMGSAYFNSDENIRARTANVDFSGIVPSFFSAWG